VSERVSSFLDGSLLAVVSSHVTRFRITFVVMTAVNDNDWRSDVTVVCDLYVVGQHGVLCKVK